MDKLFRVSSSPHVLDRDNVSKIMLYVILALLPSLIGGTYFFGWQALWVTVLTVLTCVVTEVIVQKMMNRPVTITDWSAVVTGILLAFNMPSNVPFYLPIVGGVFAIAIAKQAFGGLGFNPVNPALAARAFLLASWPIDMTVFKVVPRGGTLSGIDAITSATPLNVMKQSLDILKNQSNYALDKVSQAQTAVVQLKEAYGHLFWGNVGGCLGETSAFLILLGAAFLMYKRIIDWRIPFSYLLTVAVLAWMFGGPSGLFSGDWLFHLLAGGVMLGAFFMATDMVTSPLTPSARIYFGIGAGILTVIIRLWGGYPEGTSYSILLMNLTVPLLDRYTRPRILGERRKK